MLTEIGEIIIFRTNKMRKADQVKLSRSLYGYIEKSFYNKYAYPREGILDKIPHIRPLNWRAVLVTNTSDASKVVQLLQKYSAQIYMRRIELEEEDIQILCRGNDTMQPTQPTEPKDTRDTGGTGEETQTQDDQ